MQEVKTGQTDYTVPIFIPDSASTDGSGKTGLVAANLTVSYIRVETDNDVTVTDATSSLNNLASLTAAHADWGLIEVSSTLAPGLYRLDIADAVFASGAWSAVVYVMVTTSAAVATPMEFILVPQSPVDGVLLAPTTHTSAVVSTVTTLTNLPAITAGWLTATGIAADAITAAKIADGAIDAATFATDAITAAKIAADAGVEIAAAVWDRVLNAANHNIASSAGRRLRTLDASSIIGGTAGAGASNSITLDGTASATNEIYDSNLIVITGGTGAGQSRVIVEYNGSTRVAIVNQTWDVTPDNTSTYEIIADHQSDIIEHGLAQAGSATTITLATTASSVNDIYNGTTIYISTSTGTGQVRLITDYVGSTKVATVSPAWVVNPGSSSVYKIIPTGRAIVDSVSSDAVTAIQSGLAVTGDAMTLTSGERTSIGTAVWASATRTLSSFGTLIADIWASATRTLSAFAFTPTPSNVADTTAIKAVMDKVDTALVVDGAVYQFTANALELAPAGVGGSAPTVEEIAAEILATDIETGETLLQCLRLLRAVMYGVSDATDPEAGTVVFKRKDGTTTALTAVYTAQGDRTTITVGTV